MTSGNAGVKPFPQEEPEGRQQEAAINSIALDVADCVIDLTRSDDADDIVSAPWSNRVQIFSGRKTWSSLALALFLHSALACLLWYSPKPQVQIHKWMEVQLVSLDSDANAAGPGLEAPLGPAARESQELPSAHLPREQKDLPTPQKKNIEADVHPKKIIKPRTASDRHEEVKPTAQLDPAQSGNPDSPSQGLGKIASTGAATAAFSGDGPPAGAGNGSGGNGSLDRTFGSADGPSFLHKVVPSYPALAKRLEKEGTVLLRVTIDEQGRPLEIVVLKKAGFGFDEEAVKAVKDSSFVPAKRDGKPLACRALLPIRFVLTQS
ncbi:MAG: energy transducer TonB [Syntrophobacteraceae bacterium]